jgi:hypothetical protein
MRKAFLQKVPSAPTTTCRHLAADVSNAAGSSLDEMDTTGRLDNATVIFLSDADVTTE